MIRAERGSLRRKGQKGQSLEINTLLLQHYGAKAVLSLQKDFAMSLCGITTHTAS